MNLHEQQTWANRASGIFGWLGLAEGPLDRCGKLRFATGPSFVPVQDLAKGSS